VSSIQNVKKSKQVNSIKEIEKSGKRIYLSDSIEFIERFFKEMTFTIKSDIPTINTIQCKIKKGNRCFKYKAREILPFGPPVKYQSEGYGFLSPFMLENDSEILNVKYGVNSLTFKPGQRFESEGEITVLESNFGGNKAYYRAIIPLENFAEKPLKFIESNGFKVGTSIRIAGYISVDTGQGIYGLYDYKTYNEVNSIIIENEESSDYSMFERTLGAIIYSFGIISGSLIRNEIFILQYENKEYNQISGFQFRKLEDSINGIKSIDPGLLRDWDRRFQETSFLPSIVFSNLVKKCLTDVRFQRAIKIITESSIYPLEIRASTYSVALETLKNIVLEENVERINPFKSRKEASKVIKQIKGMVEAVDEEKFNNKKAVLSKIEQLNQVTNRDAFLLTFELLGIQLNDDDRKCIANRNDFLHGQIPFEYEHDENYQLQHTVYKLHFLISSIVLRIANYTGFILNTIKLADLFHFKNNFKEPLFRK
jgi:hypothetical protein